MKHLQHLHQHKLKDHKHKRGFIMTTLVISLPLFVTCLMVFASLIFCIRNHDLSQTICLRHTLKAQTQIKRALQTLLTLNPVADRLRNIQKHLGRLYRQSLRAGNFITAGVLKTQIEIIKYKRRLLDQQQKRILNGTSKDLQKNFANFKRQMTKFHARHIQKDHYHPVPLAVKARPKGDIAPAYHPVRGFSDKQKISFSWQMPLYRFLPKWLKTAFFQNGLSAYDCSATIKKNGLGWKAVLALGARPARFYSATLAMRPTNHRRRL